MTAPASSSIARSYSSSVHLRDGAAPMKVEPARRQWTLDVFGLYYDLAAPMSSAGLLAGIALVRQFGCQGHRYGQLPLGLELPKDLGGEAGMFCRIAAHASANAAVWCALLRLHRRSADTALLAATAPHGDAKYRRALLRFERADERLLIRAAAECHGHEFERIARRFTRRVLSVSAIDLPWAEYVLDDFRAACASQIAVAPPPLWAPLFDAEEVTIRERALGLLF